MNINQMMKQAQAMQKKMQDMQAEINNKEYTGEAGGGLVNITISGEGFMLKCIINPSLCAVSEKDMLEDLIVVAHNDAKAKIDEDSKSTMGGAFGGMSLPAGFKMPF